MGMKLVNEKISEPIYREKETMAEHVGHVHAYDPVFGAPIFYSNDYELFFIDIFVFQTIENLNINETH